MDYLPKDPAILGSSVNIFLRDQTFPKTELIEMSKGSILMIGEAYLKSVPTMCLQH